MMMKIKRILKNIGMVQLTSALMIVAFSAIVGVNCSGFSPLGIGGNDGNNSSSSAADEDFGVSLLTSEQILKSMLSATGTESSSQPTAADDLITSTYNQRSGSFPSSQSLSQATGPMLISVANVASAVCKKAVENDAGISEGSRDNRLFFRTVDFSAGITTANESGMVDAFDLIARNSWRRQSTAQEKDMIANFVTEFKAGDDGSQSAQAETKLLAISVCTAVLTSIDALTY
jgi:hypothetical protein